MISWSKWVDPMGRNKGDFEYIPESQVESFDNDRNDVFDEDEDEEVEDNTHVPVVVTPLGILPLRPFNDPTKVFNFWLGETTFSITPPIAAIINNFPGIEIFDIFTRYRFRIAIGNNFKSQQVRHSLEIALDAVTKKDRGEDENMSLDEDVKAQVQQIIQIHLSKYPYWAIYVLPNGKIDMAAAQEETSEFQEKIEVYQLARKLAGGAIFKHDEGVGV
jgi:hypothetical protein